MPVAILTMRDPYGEACNRIEHPTQMLADITRADQYGAVLLLTEFETLVQGHFPFLVFFIGMIDCPAGELIGAIGPFKITRLCHRRSEEQTSEIQSLMRISYAIFCLKKKRTKHQRKNSTVSIQPTTKKSSAT